MDGLDLAAGRIQRLGKTPARFGQLDLVRHRAFNRRNALAQRSSERTAHSPVSLK